MIGVAPRLREYQARAVDAARGHLRDGKRSVLLVAPTGAGKSVIMTHIALGAVEKGTRVVVLVHRYELRSQMLAHLKRAGVPTGPGTRVDVLMVQTLTARRTMPEAGLVLWDEVHHAVSATWKELGTEYLKAGAVLIGVTATPERDDGIGLGQLFQAMHVVAQRSELTREGFLVPCAVVAPDGMVKKLAQDPHVAYREQCPGKRAAVFAPTVAAAEAFLAGFRADGVEAVLVHGKLGMHERARRLAAFTQGRARVIVNVGVLTEGWDDPALEVIIMARKTGSISLYDQIVGRVLRTAPGKTSALLVDLSGSVAIHGPPDEDRIYSLDGIGIARAGASDGVRFCKVCKCEIPQGEPRCPDCLRPASEISIPKSEHIRLIRLAEREKWAAGLKPDKRRDLLAALYAKGIEKGWKRAAAEFKYAGVMRGRPDAALRSAAWTIATNRVAANKGDAWQAPTG